MIDKKKLVILILLTIWMGVIFLFSHCNSTVSSHQTQVVMDILSFLNISTFIDQSHVIRKLAHLLIFFILSVISFISYRIFNKTYFQTIIYSLLFIILCATLDEFHQYFIPGRSCQFSDIIIDTFGGFIGLVICSISLVLKNICKQLLNWNQYFKQTNKRK